ncbi:heme lyase CcmF/NrfE family subunit [Oceanibaculum indicum]|uniref:Cytochrome c-type biogenesis protein cycK n=1 Tax=Oceanibaculum indicum P24 TaxID=1207063 RepID=K2KL77_9PROT|nr:heme lyase CcmF/NrfE family subunit [Oceanibaculum indicum]EKE78150.1 Cytochrome c-type biogenesis protein cycK [Oceanibaculum indicum P24]
MIAEIGHYALVLALLVSAVQSLVPMLGATRGSAALMATGPAAAAAQFALVLVSFLALTWAFVTSDFSVSNVMQNSHSAKPMLYKITGVWGNHEGSMLLWSLILALFGAMVGVFGRNLPPSLKARVLSVQGMIGVGFLLFILLTSNPFERVFPPPLDGNDLNPLLQDPGLAFHPPFLYLGYVGFSVAFSFAVAALIEGRVDPAWARWVRPWTLAAWTALTLGIALGSWWAYYELGWGGWWFWDPVENASFLPWLAGTALLHSAIVVEKRDALKSWTILLAIITFGLSLMGTFLVRSGILTSVHAFAVDPDRGAFILVLLVLAVGGSLVLYALRAPSLQPGGLFQPVSREGGLVLNNLLLATATATVLLGTLYPLLLDAMTGERVSVGPPFFNATFIPLMVPLVLLMAAGPMLAWKRADLAGVLGRLRVAIGVSVIVALAVFYFATRAPVLSAFGFALATWLLMGVLTDWAERVKLFRVPLGDALRRAGGLPRSAYGMWIAHAGMAVVIYGITGDILWKTESVNASRPGETLSIAGYDLRFDTVRRVQGPNYVAEQGVFTVRRNGDFIAELTPERRVYPVTRMPTTEAAIRSNGLSDLYVVIGESNEGGLWTVRLYHNPLVPWIWFGAVIMAAGGLVSLADRRLRIGAPARQSRDAALPVPAE